MFEYRRPNRDFAALEICDQCDPSFLATGIGLEHDGLHIAALALRQNDSEGELAIQRRLSLPE